MGNPMPTRRWPARRSFRRSNGRGCFGFAQPRDDPGNAGRPAQEEPARPRARRQLHLDVEIVGDQLFQGCEGTAERGDLRSRNPMAGPTHHGSVTRHR